MGDDGDDLKFVRHTPLAHGTLLVAIEEDGATTLSSDAGDVDFGTFDLDDDFKQFRAALAKAASQFPRGGPGPMVETMDWLGIDLSICSPHQALGGDYRYGNEEVATAAADRG